MTSASRGHAEIVPPHLPNPIRNAMLLASSTSNNASATTICEAIDPDAMPGAHFAGLLRAEPTSEPVGADHAPAANDVEATDLDLDDDGQGRQIPRRKRAPPASESSHAEDADAPKRQLARNVVGPRLRAAREAAGFQQSDAATRLGYAGSAQVSQHEQGKRLPPLPELIRAASLYGTTVDYLVGVTSEDDRDPSRALRAATVRGLRGIVDGLATGLVDVISNHARLVGPNAVCSRRIVSAGQALIDALDVLMRQPQFDDTKGSAAVALTALEFEVRLHEVRNAIEKFDRLDLDLRERIANVVAASDE